MLIFQTRRKGTVNLPFPALGLTLDSNIVILFFIIFLYLNQIATYLKHTAHCKSDEFGVPSLRVQIRTNKSRMNSVNMNWFIGSRQAFIQSLGKHDLSCFGLSIGTSFAVKGSGKEEKMLASFIEIHLKMS